MIKSVKHTYVNLDKELDKLDEMIEKVYNEACEMLQNRWVFMDSKKVVYDNEVVACIPDTKYYKCQCDFSINKVKDYFISTYPTAFNFENLNWDFMTWGEVYKLTKFLEKNRHIKTVSFAKLNGIVFSKNINWKDRSKIHVYEEGGNILPILRLNGIDSKKLENQKVFSLWLDNEFIPMETKLKEEYQKVIAIHKKYKLNIDSNIPKLDREAIKNDHKNNALDLDIQIEVSEIQEEFLDCDRYRFDFDSYDSKILTDPNRGHWELKLEPSENKDLKIELDQEIVYRNPLKDVKDGGVIGIDFGTKSTVVVCQEDSTDIRPLRVGTGSLKKELNDKQYENPTIMEFINLEKFLKDYNESLGRPQTKWSDVTISHTAFDSLIDGGASNEDFYAYFSDIKQWCGTKDKRIRLKDKNKKTYDLPTFMELSDDDLNPVEIYAYYLGLYINNMKNGIYLNYILSFPVTYEKEIRDKVIKAFECGIKKSLPNEILEDEESMKKFSVISGASEPAAYAISALSSYGFDPTDDEKIFYGVFDFGGGTTDFDFGIYREADKKERRRYDYVIEHFGAEGDRYLGGENLLELLAFETFKLNANELLQNDISFVKPPECKKFAGSESLISESQEARLNTKYVMKELRPIWERHTDYEKIYEKGEIQTNLYKNDGKLENFNLKIDSNHLEKVLEERIEKGVRNFFESLRKSFSNKQANGVDKINIFLAGNSSKSKIVKDLFKEYTQSETKKIFSSIDEVAITTEENILENESLFEIFPPLGTDEAYEKMESLGIDFNKDDIEKPTGKTGVAFGLVEGRKGGRIKVVNSNNKEDDEVKFRYYVGENRKKKLKPILSPDVNYSEWFELIDASEEDFEIYYTSLPEASTKNLDINQTTKINCKLEQTFDDEDVMVYIRATKPTVIEYVVAKEVDGGVDLMSEVKEINLG